MLVDSNPLTKDTSKLSNIFRKSLKKDVYIGTSNKTEKGRSPFNFKEKVKIMTTMFGIPKSKIGTVKTHTIHKKFLKDLTKKLRLL